MDASIEIEAKVLLKKQYFDKILSFFLNKPHKYILQTNYYIDSVNRDIKKKQVSLRVRKTNIFEMTLKIPLKEGKKEINQIISEQEFDNLKNNVFPKGDIYNILNMLSIDVKRLNIIAFLTTERIESNYKGCIVCVDKNFYANKKDYEIEVEAKSMIEAKKICQEILNIHGIYDFEFNKITKQARAIISNL